MKIAYIIPGTGMTGDEHQRRTRLLQQVAGEDITVKLLAVDEGPAAIESAEDEIAAVAPTLNLARQHENEFDAFIIGCFGDVGIDALRNEIKIPVIGPARATYAIAAAVFSTFGILSLNSGFIEEEREITQKLGVLSQVSDIRALDLPVEVIVGEPDQTLQRIRECIGSMAAPAAVPGCMSMAFLLAERSITSIRAVRIVNPLFCAVRAATVMVA